MDFTDLASRYATTRFDQATQPFTDPEAYMNRRLGLDNSTDQGNVKPVTQTITTDPSTGDQTMTVKGRPEDLSAANPLTPTVTMPGQPPAAQPTFNFGQTPVAQPPAVMPTQPVQPPAMAPTGMMPTGGITTALPQTPLPETSNVQPGEQIPTGQIPQPIMDDTGKIVGYETPNAIVDRIQQQQGGPINPAASVPTAPVATPPIATPPVVAPAAPQVPTPIPVAAPQMTPTQATVPPVVQERRLEAWQQDLVDAQKDPQKLNAYIANEKNPAEGKTMAETLLKQHYKRQEEEAKTEKDMKAFISGDRKAQTDVMKRLSSKSEEGSLFKAYLYNRFGMHDLASAEQKKLAGTNFERMMVDGQNYLVEINGQGGVIGAFDAKGKAVGEETVAKLNAGGSKFGTHAYGFTGGSITIPEGQPNAGQEYRQRTNAQTGQIENIITTGPDAGKPYTGSPGYEKRVTTQALIGSNQLIFDLQKKHGGNVLDALKEFQELKGPLNPDDRAAFLERYGYGSTIPNKLQIPGQPTTPPVVTPPVKTPVGLQSNAVEPVAPTALPPQGGMMNAGYNPNQPSGMMNAGYNPNQPQGGMIKTGGVDIGTPISTLKQQQEIATGIAKKGGETTAEIRAKLKETLPKQEETARQILATVDDVITHPGFEISVGGSEPIGSLIAKIPGTEARDWKSKYSQLSGQQFLAAFQSLRGGGSISDKEGDKAEQAIAALKDPGISEKEFLRNANILKDVVKRGVDIQREQVGLKPLDWSKNEKEENLTPQERARRELEKRRGQK